MRLKEEYKKSGYFWLPDNPEKQIPGTLTITDGGDIELEIVGLFVDTIAATNDEEDLSRIIGHVEKDGLVTLDKCFYKKKNIAFGGIAKSIIHANMVLSGVAYEKDEQTKFNSVTFSTEGINEWVGLSGISVKYSGDFKSATINYEPINEIAYTLDGGFKLYIVFGYTLPGIPHLSEAKITQQAYLRLTSDTACELQEFIDILHKLTYLLCFAVDATVTITDISARSDDITMRISDEKTIPVNIRLYYPSIPFSEQEPKIDTHRMLFRFTDIHNDAEKILNNWINAYSIIRPALGLYFSAVTGTHKYLEGKFLALAQGLETYHRRTSSETLMDRKKFRHLVASLVCLCPKENRKWLLGRLRYGNEISLARRIKQIIEPYASYLGSGKERKKIIRGIVNTRNYLTHYSENLENAAATGVKLWFLCEKMEAVFQLHLLQQLGFTKPEIENILSENHRIKQKLT